MCDYVAILVYKGRIRGVAAILKNIATYTCDYVAILVYKGCIRGVAAILKNIATYVKERILSY